jgi:hypothetical protein
VADATQTVAAALKVAGACNWNRPAPYLYRASATDDGRPLQLAPIRLTRLAG